jgi:pimeloyl-ACP methyl ester carboxylesterase
MVALALLDARCRHIVLASLLGVMVTLPGCARSERSSAAAVADSSVRLIAVAPDVRLEVLDWGGTGPAMVFLAGMGGEPDSYRAFASRFRDGYHLYGINRRGEGGSDTPMSGYDAATRAHDIIVVLDSLHVSQAIFVGHSFAGDELSKVGVTYPERVRALVYLEAYDYPGPPAASMPPFPPQDVRGRREPSTPERERLIADLEAHDSRAPDTSVHPRPAVAPDELAMQGAEHADYSKITAPALAVYADNAVSARDFFGPEYDGFDARNRAMARRFTAANVKVYRDVQERFRTQVRHGTVVVIPGAIGNRACQPHRIAADPQKGFAETRASPAPPRPGCCRRSGGPRRE